MLTMELIATLIVVGVVALMRVLLSRKSVARKKHGASSTKTAFPASSAPITTVKGACDYLQVLLASRSVGLRSIMVADMREEMREHVDELRSNIAYLTEEIAKQLEFRQAVEDTLEDDVDDAGGDVEPDDEATARIRRHLGHLDREISEMKTQLQADKLALRDFRSNRAEWVRAYANHCLHDAPNPNLGCSRHSN